MEVHDFFLILLAMLLAARMLGEAAARLGAPPVIGELAAGILLGPSLLGWVAPNDIIRLLAEIGIILLLFEVGLETDIMRLMKTGMKPIIVAAAGVLFPFLFGFAASFYLFEQSLLTALFIGGTLHRHLHRHHRARAHRPRAQPEPGGRHRPRRRGTRRRARRGAARLSL